MRISFLRHDGHCQAVDSEPGETLMRAAINGDIGGILADCGGAMTCATCHVYIDPAWLPLVGAADETEQAMLEAAIDPTENSRLSCQVVLSDAYDGLIVHVPKSQF